MQTITIEPLSYIGFLLIAVTLVYSFINYRREGTRKKTDAETEQPLAVKEVVDYARPAIVAAVAMMLEGKSYIIKRIVLSGKPEKSSSWRQFGRQEIMRRRLTMKK